MVTSGLDESGLIAPPRGTIAGELVMAQAELAIPNRNDRRFIQAPPKMAAE
jgi:hypothetical protein